MIPVFDGHNDILLRMLHAPDRREAIWLKGEGRGHLDLPRMRAGGLTAGFFAIYIPSPEIGDLDALEAMMRSPPYDMPLPSPVPAAAAVPVALAMAGHLKWMERTGTLTIATTAAQIRDSMTAGRIAAVMHMEGAEAIGPDLDALHVWHAAGLRSIGPVWSRPTVFGHGVPFRFPSGPDTGAGLTDAGKALVRECNALRIMIDLSHINEQGFDDVARLSHAPLVATHSNVHAICPSARNLTDRQLDAIAASGGMVGLNFATVFLNPDGSNDASTGWDIVMRHLDHLIDRLGEDHVGLGSDFDGATVPEVIGDAAGLPRLTDAMAAHGYDGPLIEKLAHRNWVALLERTWGA
jgi:membrane dipeptidase